ncbi:MAG: thiamine phosphate synthase [Nitrospiraceae bacterium]|nr:thiamine phosphate synthase [Nitrospiraceae bacterium]
MERSPNESPHGLYLGGLCFLTAEESACGVPAAKQAASAFLAGLKWVQLRMKDAPRRQVFEAASYLRGISREHGALLFINDYPDIALAVDADGVHLGQDDFPLEEARRLMGNKLIGISTHNMAEAREASEGGADYIGFGPIFETATKDAGPARGIGPLQEVRRQVKIPMVAIGGITPENIGGVIRVGANAAAVSAAIARGDISGNVRRFLEALRPFDRTA